MEQATVDTRKWNAKVNKLLKECGPTIAKIVAYGNTKVSTSVNKNLSGSAYYIGKLPVVRRTGTLRRAYQVHMLTPHLFIHRMNSQIAEYAKFVHDGTRYLKPRPYFRNAFSDNKQAIMNYWKYQFIFKMREIGQK